MEERQSMGNFQMRTDLALEARESISEADSKLRGVRVEERYHEEEDIRVTKVMIDTMNAARTMGKPMGIYVTMEAPAMVEPDEDYHREISGRLAEEILELLPGAEKGMSSTIMSSARLRPTVKDMLLACNWASTRWSSTSASFSST